VVFRQKPYTALLKRLINRKIPGLLIIKDVIAVNYPFLLRIGILILTHIEKSIFLSKGLIISNSNAYEKDLSEAIKLLSPIKDYDL
jgi:hypothetical protein